MVTLIPNLWVHLYLNFHVYPFGVAELDIEKINVEHIYERLIRCRYGDTRIYKPTKVESAGKKMFDEALRDIKVQLEENQQ